MNDDPSIFRRYYSDAPFVDRFETDRENAVDVIVPIIHTNELWHANLTSIYREVPVNRLLIGDGGCVDDSIEIAKKFPRVEVLDHRKFTSLGFSLRHLIEAVTTEWFVYLHSDVYLPPDWFAKMRAHRSEFDWFECEQRITVLADYLLEVPNAKRAFSGSQMGRKSAFAKVTPAIDDDFLYRNEDIIFASLVAREGYRYGKASDTFHFHQVMHKPSKWGRKVKRVGIEVELAKDEDIRSTSTFVRGIVKYLRPEDTSPDVVDSLRRQVERLEELGETTTAKFQDWAATTNPAWLPHLGFRTLTRQERVANRITNFANVYRRLGFWGTLRYAIFRDR